MSKLAVSVRALVAIVLTLAAAAPILSQTKKSRPRGRRAAAPSAAWPSFESRHADWARRKELAAQAGSAGPDALAQYLVDEVVVTGVFDTDGGHGVFLFARPTGTTFFASPGAALFNGRLAEIVDGGSGFAEDTQVVFVERVGKDGDRRVVRRIEPAPGPEPAAP